MSEAQTLDFSRSICLFSQTTKSLDGFRDIVDYITAHIQPPATFRYFDTICRQVANRLPNIQAFATRHDVVLFVSGLKSSNGRVLYEACRRVNPRSYLVDTPAALQREWFDGAQSVGVCGATSTPKWLMEDCSRAVRQLMGEEDETGPPDFIPLQNSPIVPIFQPSGRFSLSMLSTKVLR